MTYLANDALEVVADDYVVEIIDWAFIGLMKEKELEDYLLMLAGELQCGNC